MKKVRVRLEQNGYDVNIGAGLLNRTERYLRKLGFNGKVVIITDSTVRDLYGASLKQSLTGNGFTTCLLEVPEGERYKSLEVAGRLYRELAAFGAERNTPILALGGGVIGDLAGFVAATFQRGVPFIQIPTTLLAQVDSSVGGKVAIDHGKLKNMVGAFYQPKLVISDTDTLKTLPGEQLANGMAEVIKHGIIKDGAFVTYLEENIERIRACDERALEHIVTRSVQIKAEVVAQDEKDTGLRNILNFGHTVGHGIEAVTDFKVSHGQAVAIGMVAACRIAVEMDIVENPVLIRLRKLLRRAGLMAKLPQVDIKAVLEAMTHDKKVAGGKIRFVLPRAIGDVYITDEVEMKTVEKVLVRMR